jgi:glucose-1-phosphate cytidylyltransferase
MKVVILAGGFGTRISEESHLRPKPMIEIGERPILWHIMKSYSRHGFNDFVICLGYKGFVIKEYFAHYFLHESDVTFEFGPGGQQRIVHTHTAEPWKVTLVDTGMDTMTGGRVRRIRPYVGEEPFLLTYGDGVADVDIRELVEFHRRHGRLATVTAAQPTGRFGALKLGTGDLVEEFQEKPRCGGGWINAGFFVMEPGVFDYIEGDGTYLEREPMENLARSGQLMAFRHEGFWQPMDTLRDKNLLESLWRSGKAPWKTWE